MNREGASGNAPAPAPVTDAPAATPTAGPAPTQPPCTATVIDQGIPAPSGVVAPCVTTPDAVAESKDVTARIAGSPRDGESSNQGTVIIRVPTVPSSRSSGGTRSPNDSRTAVAAGGVQPDAAGLGRANASAVEAPRADTDGNDAALRAVSGQRIGWERLAFSWVFMPILGSLLTILVGVGLRLRAVRLLADEPGGFGDTEFPGAFEFPDNRDN